MKGNIDIWRIMTDCGTGGKDTVKREVEIGKEFY
jgi:hypothetical protein